MKTFILQKNTLIAIGALILIGGGAAFFSGAEESPYNTLEAQRGELIQEVSVTGIVKPAEDVSLSFERGGMVTAVYADVGDQVVNGEVLVRLRSSDLFAEYTEAQAKLDAEQAKLDALIRGTRPEEVEIQETTVQKAQATVTEEMRNLENAIDDAFIKAEDAIQVKADQMFVDSQSNQPQLNVQISNAELKSDLEQRRFLLQETLNDWETLIETLNTEMNTHENTETVTEYLNETATFLRLLSQAVSTVDSSSGIPQTTIDRYKDDVASARADVQTALSNIATMDENLNAAETNLSLQQQELNLLQAGATEEEIAEQQARVKSMEAIVARREAELAKTILRAPFTGVVTKQEAKVGEVQPANKMVVALISENRFEIEVFVPEEDIALIETGDTAMFTLDAYGEDEAFTAQVTKVDPAETQTEGVSTYKVTLAFEEREGLVRSGMTANVNIRTEQKENVFAVPAQAVQTQGEEHIVRILKEDGSVEERVVTIGLEGSDGRIEIEGVEEGERIIVSERE